MARHSRQVPISSKNNRAARAAHAKAKEAVKTYDTSAIRPKKSKTPMIILIVFLVAIAAIAFFVIRGCTAEEPTRPASEEVIFIVKNGESAKDVADALYKEKLIGSASKFVDLINEKNAASAIIPGTYLFRGQMSMDDILSALMKGPSSTGDSLTVPEGMTRKDIASAVDKATSGRVSADAFLKASENASEYAGKYEFLSDVGTNSLEGFLFPKTYLITATDDAQSVVYMMLNQFKSETENIDISYPKKMGYGWYDIVKLASVVQREGKPDNFRLIAGVFYNRLKSDRPYLESDATTAYEIGRDPTAEEVHANTPYSTYTNAGLPPTPINNPSLDAIKAACDPEQTDYQYFYTYKDGSYAFSKTYEEHQAAINRAS